MNATIATQIWKAPGDTAQAADVLRRGGLVAFPTETVYGLGADARNADAVAAIFLAKGRPAFNPLIVHVASLQAARELGKFNPQAEALADAFWPGPLTLVLPKTAESRLADLVTAGLSDVGLRVPAHPVAQALLQAFGGPIAAPSANLSGKVSPTTVQHVDEGLGGRIDGILDGGSCEVGLESTIVGFGSDGPVLLRAGGIPNEAIEACLAVRLAVPEPGKIIAPGQMYSHYAPNTALRLNASAPRETEGWLGFGTDSFPVPSRNLSPSRDLHEAATNLFAMLRELDTFGVNRVAVARIPDSGLGCAINDRLRRAAAARSGPSTLS